MMWFAMDEESNQEFIRENSFGFAYPIIDVVKMPAEGRAERVSQESFESGSSEEVESLGCVSLRNQLLY
jgi:hypothetical protein